MLLIWLTLFIGSWISLTDCRQSNSNESDSDKFYFHPRSLPYEEAVNICKRRVGDWGLLNGNKYISRNIKEFMKVKGINNAWLSLAKAKFTNWMWVNDSRYDGVLKNMPGALCAGVAIQGMALRPMVCAEKGIGFVCEMPAGESCPLKEHPELCFRVGENVIYIGCFTESWFHARSYCVKTGGDLAVLESREKQLAVLNYIIEKKYVGQCSWLFAGLRTEDWYFQPGDEIPKEPQWGPDQPRGQHSCATINSETVWGPYSCDHPAHVICQNYRHTTSSVSYKAPCPETTDKSKSQMYILIVMGLIISILILVLVVLVVYRSKKSRERRLSIKGRQVRKLDINQTTINIAMFSNGPIKEKNSNKETVNFPLDGKKSNPEDNYTPSKAANIIEEGCKKFGREGRLKLINMHFKEYKGILPDKYVVDVLQFLLDHSGVLYAVVLPRFDNNLTDIKTVLLMLWDLREKVITITEATSEPSLPADEVLAVSGHVLHGKPSGNVDFVLDDKNADITSNSSAYVVGLAGAIKFRFPEEIKGPRTKVMRHFFLNCIKRDRSIYNGFGILETDSVKEPDKKQMEETIKSIAGLGNFLSFSFEQHSSTVTEEKHLYNGTKIKIALLRPCAPPKDERLKGWTINIENGNMTYKGKNKFQDEELQTVTQTLLYLRPNKVDLQTLYDSFEINWYSICDEGWTHSEVAWREFIDKIKSCDVVYVTNIMHKPSTDLQQNVFDLSKQSVVLTQALSNGRKGAPGDIPVDRVIAIGRRFQDEPEIQEEREIKSNESIVRSEHELGLGKSEERIPLMHKDITIGRFKDQSNGSTLDFVCGFDLVKDKVLPGNFQAVAVVAMILAKARLLDIDENIMKRVCTTSVMHAILRQMSSHPEFHTIDEGWGELQPQPWLNDDDRFQTLLKYCSHANNENRYWAGKNV